MKKPSSYPSAVAFRQALEARLNNIARDGGIDIQRLRRQVAFDRLLCRLFHNADSPWALKGGYAMELRLHTTRTTKDIDLSWRGKLKAKNKTNVASILRAELQEAAAADLSDHFAFLIGQAIMDLDAAPYGGGRFPVEARMAGRVFVRFHVDVGAGDAVLDPLEDIQPRDWLDFAGIPARSFPSISREQQFAEKLHAYTRPRTGAPNTRVRDLVDMVLLIRIGLDRAQTTKAVSSTFTRRGTHTVPSSLTPPPPDWKKLYGELADECRLTEDLEQAFGVVEKFFKDSIHGGQSPVRNV